MPVRNDPSDDLAPERLEAVVDLIEFAGRLAPSTAIVPGGHRVEDLRLVESARDHGIVERIILVGDQDRILAAVSEVGIAGSPSDLDPVLDRLATAGVIQDIVYAVLSL
jgi:hypothetical protein